MTTTIEKTLRKTLHNVVPRGWKQKKRRASLGGRMRSRDIYACRYAPPPGISVKDAVYKVMEEAYMKASANNTLPANARQIMYAVRPLIQEITDKELASSYFTQTLLPDYVRDHGLEADWDVVYDSRGHLKEPHTDRVIPLGTIDVRNYIGKWASQPDGSVQLQERWYETHGPNHRYRYAMFIEKEGFNSLFEKAQLAERFDIAIMSTKGMSVTAARSLIEAQSADGVTIFAVHDCDDAGFTIARTLYSDTRRYEFCTTPDVIDLGLHPDDVAALGLQSESFRFKNGRTGTRVELNAMTSPQFIKWLEGKFAAHGVTKIVPEADELKKAYQLAYQRAAIEKVVEEAEEEKATVPRKLEAQVRAYLRKNPAESWDNAVLTIAREAVEGADNENGGGDGARKRV